ncbi:MAG TPA: Xaa-Pro peptidase family protein [Vicinamibacterales bacterium]|nr:Xaa-Pro peptidase family protein [Vicinamibacterales bacterium]
MIETLTTRRSRRSAARRAGAALLAALLLLGDPLRGQHYQTDFPPEEFRARWMKLFERIGADAVAVLQGMPQTDGFIYPRQYNNFYYLSGIETPGAYLRLDGRTRRVTLYLPPRDERLERAEGRVLSADDAALVQQLTGVDEVRPVSAMAEADWPVGPAAPGQARARAVIYAEFMPPEGAQQSRGELVAAEAARARDYWDGATLRHRRFVELLRSRHPRAEIRDLIPILDELRAIKSPREIALIRRASQLAGLGLMEAMRSTEPGVYEYQLDAAARYVFLVHGARLEAYRSITASGTENIANMHYFRNTAQLRDGDLVLMDYAPDYRYYVSDVGRVWPVNGRFTAWQRELLGFVLAYHKATLARIRPGVTPAQVMAEVRAAMEPILARTRFTKPAYEQAARRLVETGGGVFSHTVGMAVHDVGSYRDGLRPGHVFSVDPQLRVPEENLYLRYEDTVVVTDTGVENFTSFLPMELEDIERVVQEKGIVQLAPALTEAQFTRLGTR